MIRELPDVLEKQLQRKLHARIVFCRAVALRGRMGVLVPAKMYDQEVGQGPRETNILHLWKDPTLAPI